MDLKSTPNGPVEGVVIESTSIHGLGKVCTLIVKRGTLKKGTVLVAGSAYGRVKLMLDEFGKNVLKAGPSTPVRIAGWKNKLPNPGDIIFEVVDGESLAQKIAAEYSERDMLKEAEKYKVSFYEVNLINLYLRTKFSQNVKLREKHIWQTKKNFSVKAFVTVQSTDISFTRSIDSPKSEQKTESQLLD
jgi:translation initiation factor IF-2